MAVHAVGGDLPPIGDVLADLVPVAIPLAPLAVVLGCREAHLVLLQEEQHRSAMATMIFSVSYRRGGKKQEDLDVESLPGAWASAAWCSSYPGSLYPSSI